MLMTSHKKLGEGDMMNLVYGLAQSLGEVADDILHPSLWKTQLSRAQADAYIDILEEQWKKQREQGMVSDDSQGIEEASL